MKTSLFIKLLILAAVLPLHIAIAQTNWTGTSAAGTNEWNDPDNWSAGVPGSGSTANINNGDTVYIGLASEETADAATLNVGTTSGGGALIISNSSMLANGGTTTVVTVGAYGRMEILSGGTVRGFGMIFGNSASGTGSVTVNGSNSVLHAYNWFTIGSNGAGALTVENGGKVLANNGNSTVAGGGGTNAKAIILVTGEGSQWTNANLYLGRTGTGTVTISDKGYVLINSSLNLGLTESISSRGIVGHGEITVNTGGTLQVNGVTNIGYTTLTFGPEGGSSTPINGSGAVVVDGVNSFWYNTGALNIGVGATTSTGGGGAVTVQNGGSLYVGATNVWAGTINLATNANVEGTLNIGDVSGTTAAGTVRAAVITGGAGDAFVNFNQNNAEITFAPRLEGSLTVTHSSTGKTILSGSNNYTGNTNILNGTLALGSAASIANSGTITVSAGAVFDVSDVSGFMLEDGQTLTGDGNVAGEMIIDTGATLAASAASLTFANGLTISDGAILDFTPGAPITVADGTLHLGEGVILNLAGAGSYTLFDYTDADLEGAGNWNTWNLGEFGGTGYTRTWGNAEGVLTLTVTPVPEPGTWAIMLSGLGVLAGIQRLRRRK